MCMARERRHAKKSRTKKATSSSYVRPMPEPPEPRSVADCARGGGTGGAPCSRVGVGLEIPDSDSGVVEGGVFLFESLCGVPRGLIGGGRLAAMTSWMEEGPVSESVSTLRRGEVGGLLALHVHYEQKTYKSYSNETNIGVEKKRG